MDSELQKVLEESENVVEKEEMVQEGDAQIGGAQIGDAQIGDAQIGGTQIGGTQIGNPGDTLDKNVVVDLGNNTIKSLLAYWTAAQKWDSSLQGFLGNNFNINGTQYTDRPLLLSDLYSLNISSSDIPSTGRAAQRKNLIQNLFDNIPLAQYKHLPDPAYLGSGSSQTASQDDTQTGSQDDTQTGGNIDESTLPTQEVSLPPEPIQQIQEPQEQLPSLDIVEPSSTGGSYKWSSHKKRKSTRIRTKKNKK